MPALKAHCASLLVVLFGWLLHDANCAAEQPSLQQLQQQVLHLEAQLHRLKREAHPQHVQVYAQSGVHVSCCLGRPDLRETK